MDRVPRTTSAARLRESVPHQVTVASAQGGEATNPGVAADSAVAAGPNLWLSRPGLAFSNRPRS
jgi:hypothetical protein